MPAAKPQRIPFKMHPRVFAALGPDLVTNDVVAIIELVKNSYDALATRVDVRIREDEETDQLVLDVQDDGTGMTKKDIQEVWAVVATPHRQLAPVSKKANRSRRVSGEKGLGRLSTARLGNSVELLTKAEGDRCWKVNVDWTSLTKARRISSCVLEISPHEPCPFKKTGTLIKIADLKSEWNDERFEDLQDQLSRLISPFEAVKDFEIHLTLPGHEAQETQIEVPEFLSSPPYFLKGAVSSKALLTGEYRFRSGIRTATINKDLLLPAEREQDSSDKETECGPFSFELRAWDIDAESMEELATSLNMGRRQVRDVIRNYKGVSLYRDKVLVLPKSEGGKDWLALDLRRVSKTGTRLSTNQIVGYVSISSRENSGIHDTSDRERLAENEASKQFKGLLKRVVGILEIERDKDRQEKSHREPPLKDLLGDLSASHLVANVQELAHAGAPAKDALPLVEDFSAQVEDTVAEIEKRFFYYSRVASLGLIAATIVHEVRNQCTVIGKLVSILEAKRTEKTLNDPSLDRQLELAHRSVGSLERLADKFAPLASRSSPKSRQSNLLTAIRDCIDMRAKEIESRHISVDVQTSEEIAVQVNLGELIAIIINFLDNALYWIQSVSKDSRRIVFEAVLLSKERVEVYIHDSGPGVEKGDEERIFWPGVTRKPEGLGMGLTVASELISQHGGRTRLIVPGELGGASFAFDLPMSNEAK